MDLSRRFSFGVNLDDTWRYCGVKEPKSIIFPHLLSLSLRETGAFEKVEGATISSHNQPIPQDEADRACLALADSLSSIGADFVRCWFPWRFFEPTPVPRDELRSLAARGYDSWPTDGLVRALTGQGISVIPVLACGYQRMLPQGLSPDVGVEEYLERAYQHVKLLVGHYKGAIGCWQVENEPNWWVMHEAGGWRTGASWREGKGFRDALLKTLNAAVHEEDPRATTMVNLEADEERLEVTEYAEFCDLIGLDFYPNYKAAEPVSASVIKRADSIATTAGKPVMIAETGYPSGPSILGYNKDKQSDYVALALRNAYFADRVTAVGIWRYLDTSWTSFPPQENHFGLIDEKSGPKDAWYRLGRVIKELRA